jgi:hypothetical protein
METQIALSKLLDRIPQVQLAKTDFEYRTALFLTSVEISTHYHSPLLIGVCQRVCQQIAAQGSPSTGGGFFACSGFDFRRSRFFFRFQPQSVAIRKPTSFRC